MQVYDLARAEDSYDLVWFMGVFYHLRYPFLAARAILGYQRKVSLEPGLTDLAEWLEAQLADDHVESAGAELAMRGLTL